MKAKVTRKPKRRRRSYAKASVAAEARKVQEEAKAAEAELAAEAKALAAEAAALG